MGICLGPSGFGLSNLIFCNDLVYMRQLFTISNHVIPKILDRNSVDLRFEMVFSEV